MYQSVINRLSFFDGLDILEPLIRHDFKDRIALVSSFGAESAVLLHMAAQVDRNVPVIFIDTDKLFWETHIYRSALIDRLGLTNIRTLHPDAAAIAEHDPDGELNARNADLCCRIRKVEPLERALNGFNAWISGRKRFHGGVRSSVPTLEVVDGRLKVEPLARFTASDLDAYFRSHDLPRHPLAEQGYRSIGCVPCTVKAGNDDDPRAGRWSGSGKTECGIHWTANGKPIRVVAKH